MPSFAMGLDAIFFYVSAADMMLFLAIIIEL
jgi:hypothetical protein